MFDKFMESYKKRYGSGNTVQVLREKLPYLREILVSRPDKSPQVNYWRESYVDYIEKMLAHMKGPLYLPRYLSKKIYKRPYWHEYIKSSKEVELSEFFDFNGIKLPKPKAEDEGIFGDMILDTLLQHILNFNLDFIKKVDYDFYRFMPEGPYEYGNIFLSEGDIVIDAGACMGEFSALAAYKKCRPYAFEASKRIREEYLDKTIELNPGIVVAPYALSAKKETLEFTLHSTNMGASFLSKIEGLNQGKKTNLLIGKEIVQAIDLDSYVNENDLPRVDFIKSDIEGAEREMLKGAQGVLKEFAPKLALSTYHLPDDPQVMKELILQANPDYIIEQKFKKLYAYVPDKN